MKEQTLRKTILVVDDEEGVRESVREVLSDEGYRVIDTGDGGCVMDLIRQEKPDLLVRQLISFSGLLSHVPRA